MRGKQKYIIFVARCRNAFTASGNYAQMAELVDALVSGTSIRKYVQVRVLFWARQTGRLTGKMFPLTLWITVQPAIVIQNAQVVKLVDTPA
jgi:hypothetical protein